MIDKKSANVIYEWPLSEVTCGGGHRSWDFNGVDFAFIKDRQLMFCKEFLTSDTSMTIKTGLHSLVINCVEHCHFGSKVERAIQEFWGFGATFLLALKLGKCASKYM